MTPQIGVSSEYASNPYLLPSGSHAVNDEALLLNAPTNYDLDMEHFSLTPSVRYSGGNYASLASNYYHLSSAASYVSDTDTVAASSTLGRDSSLYQGGIKSNGVGVRADSILVGGDWQHSLNDRALTEFDLSYNRVLYNQQAGQTGLVDYRYLSEGVSGTYAVTELTKAQLSGGAGQYVAIDGVTRSKNYNLQIGGTRLLTELWTLTAGLGYARSNNSINLYYGPFFLGGVQYGPYYLGTTNSTQQGPVYNLSLTRQGQKLNLTLLASRAFRPSGFEFLSRTDYAELNLAYTQSDHWSFGAKAGFQNTATPGANGTESAIRYTNPQLSADYHWTTQWIISLRATWVNVKYPLQVRTDSTGLSLQFSRQFLRIDL